MDESEVAKPPFLQFFLATLWAGVLGTTLEILLYPGTSPLTLGTVLLIWFVLKIYQRSLHRRVGLEFRTGTIFWYLVGVGILVGLPLWIALGAKLVATPFSFGWWALWTVLTWVLTALLSAALFRYTTASIPAWREIKAYWRPFYAGFHLRLGGKPEGPPADSGQDPS